jgi:hypothetical protein
MRHFYPITDETRKVINEHVDAIAKEMGVSDKYIYRVMGKAESDPFAKFLTMYVAALRLGISVVPWITALKLLEEKYRPLSKELCVITEAKKFVKESNDVAVAHMGDEDLLKLREEQIEANMQGERALAAINQEIDRRNTVVLYNGNPVSFATRDAVRSTVRNGRAS